MAGETPNGDKNSKRRKVRWQDNRSADKYYSSGQNSVISDQSQADTSSTKVGTDNGKINLSTDDRSADKYYAEGGSKRVRGAIKAAQERKARALQNIINLKKLPNLQIPVAQPIKAAGSNPVADTIDGIVKRLLAGETGITLLVPHGDKDMLRRMRAALELRVTREDITEDQGREVRIAYASQEPTKTVEDQLGEVKPRGETAVPVEEVFSGDVRDFLNAEEPEVTPAVLAVTEVDTTNDVVSSPVAAEESDDDGADNTFAATTPVTQPEVPQNRKGRRSGRNADK